MCCTLCDLFQPFSFFIVFFLPLRILHTLWANVSSSLAPTSLFSLIPNTSSLFFPILFSLAVASRHLFRTFTRLFICHYSKSPSMVCILGIIPCTLFTPTSGNPFSCPLSLVLTSYTLFNIRILYSNKSGVSIYYSLVRLFVNITSGNIESAYCCTCINYACSFYKHFDTGSVIITYCKLTACYIYNYINYYSEKLLVIGYCSIVVR